MKTRVAAAVLAAGMIFGAWAQSQINMSSNQIWLDGSSDVRLISGATANSYILLQAPNLNIRNYYTGDQNTTHYGNMLITGGYFGGNGGWLTANRAQINGALSVTGAKNFIHPHTTNDSKVIRYVAIESGESITLARGTAKTENGQVTITLPEHFAMVTNKDAPITVLLTPNGAPVLLYTKHVSRETITVAMKNSDFSEFRDVEFSYQVSGVRDGFEKYDVVIDMEELFSKEAKADSEKTEGQRRIEALEERLRARGMEGIEIGGKDEK